MLIQYLQTVIPYKCPDGLRWKTDTLIQLTKGISICAAVVGGCVNKTIYTVLKAIAEGSSTVPKLMAEYLQSECKLFSRGLWDYSASFL